MRKFQIPNQPETGSSPGLWRSEKVRIVLMAVALLIVGGAFLVSQLKGREYRDAELGDLPPEEPVFVEQGVKLPDMDPSAAQVVEHALLVAELGLGEIVEIDRRVDRDIALEIAPLGVPGRARRGLRDGAPVEHARLALLAASGQARCEQARPGQAEKLPAPQHVPIFSPRAFDAARPVSFK